MAGTLKAKTLYIGLYDYPYCGQAYVLNGGKFEEYGLSDAEIDMLHYLYRVNGDLRLWSVYWEYSRDEINECLERLSAVFSDIVVCSDGIFEYIKLK